MMYLRSLTLLVAIATTAAAQTYPATTVPVEMTRPVAGVDEQVTLFANGDGYTNFRIPAVVVTKAGTVLAFCEARANPRGPTNDSGDIDLVLRRSTDHGRTFGPRQIVWDDAGNTCGNPCPVIDQRTGRIVLAMTHNLGLDRESMIVAGTSKGTRTVWVCHSDDDGVTWSRPRDVTTTTKKPEWAWYATGPGVGIQLARGPHAGRLIIPCDYVVKGGKGDDAGNSHVIYSDDGGETWVIGGEPPNKKFNESQIVERADGSVLLNMRNRGRGATGGFDGRGVAVSTDGGVTFAAATEDTTLVEPRCQASVIRYSWPDGGKSRLLFSNPARRDERKEMTVRVSYDEGATWPESKLIYPGWTGYSCLAPLADGTVGLFYEAGNSERYQRIEFARLKLEWLTDGRAPTVKPRIQTD